MDNVDCIVEVVGNGVVVASVVDCCFSVTGLRRKAIRERKTR